MYLVAMREPLIELEEDILIREDVLTSLCYLRDAMEGRLGSIAVLAPLGTQNHIPRPEILVPFHAQEHGLRLVTASHWSSGDSNESTLANAQYEIALSKLLCEASILQVNWQDLACWGSSPAMLDLIRESGTPILVKQSSPQEIVTLHDKTARISKRSKVENLREKALRNVLVCAELCLFESYDLMRRYGPYCRNARLIRSSGVTRDQVISAPQLEKRSQLLNKADPIRLAFVDALTESHGIHHAVTIVRRAVALGANFTLQICNDGPERQVVRYQLAKTPLEDRIVLKPLPLSSAIIRETLENSHGLLRTPLVDVDDSSTFMGFTAGLPMISYDESIALTHAVENRSVILMPNLCIDIAARRLLELDQNRDWLFDKSILAREAGLSYSIESVFERQAEHTMRLIEDKLSPQNSRNLDPTAERMPSELAATAEES